MANGIDLDISKMLLELSNEKKRLKKESLNIKTEYKSIIDTLVDFKCSDCASLNIKEIDGYYVCLECGLKIENIIDSGQEWRNFNNDDSKGIDNSRCDIPTNELLPKTSMGSLVGYSCRETYTTKRIRNMNNWYSVSYKDSSLMESFNNITIIALNSGLNQCIIDEAKFMFKRVSDIKSSRRTKKEGMKAGALALACKLKGVPRNCDEIAKICRMSNTKTLRKSIKTFEEIWNTIIFKEKTDLENLKKEICSPDTKVSSQVYNQNVNEKSVTDIDDVDSNSDNNDDSSSSDDEDNSTGLKNHIGKLHRFISAMCLDEKIFEACSIILQYTEKKNYLDKHNPLSRITAIIFYIVDRLHIKINKFQIIKTCQVSEVTINKCYMKLVVYKEELNNILLPV